MEQISRFYLPGGLLLITLFSGFWLSHTGRPLNGLLFTVHKLVALAAVVLMGIRFAGLMKIASPALGMAFLVMGAISALALFASGALLSQVKPASTLVLRIHQVSPVLLVGSLVTGIVLFINRLVVN